jgi:hypothetical protein
VAFDPDVAVATAVPVALDPTSVGVGWFHVVSGNPDIAVAIPAMVAIVPCPFGMLVGWRRNVLNWALWWTDADDDLGLCNTSGEKKCTSENGEEFFHRAISLKC